MPSVRLLPREAKRRALEYSQKTNELLAALEVNDLTRAEKLVNEIEGMAKDFDTSKPLAKIETAKTISAMHLAKARNAAVSGDKSAMEAELRSAAQIWPRNPALAEVGNTIFTQSDVQQQAMNDFDRLLSQKNHRQIYNDKLRFIAAAAMYPEKQKELNDVLQRMAAVEGAILKAQEIAGRGDPAGAWESVQAAQKEFPDDSELNQLRATLTTQAADFVQTLAKAEALENQEQKILLVDGHSMIFDWPDLAAMHARNTAAAREELVKRLTGLQDNTEWTVAVVFDGKGVKASSDGTPHGIAVFYSKSGQTADSIIERLAAKYAKDHEVTVATNDRLERTTAEAFGSNTISGMQLRAEIESAIDSVRDTIRRLRR
jgi:predicted RNA-binding protein with PIN domain